MSEVPLYSNTPFVVRCVGFHGRLRSGSVMFLWRVSIIREKSLSLSLSLASTYPPVNDLTGTWLAGLLLILYDSQA